MSSVKPRPVAIACFGETLWDVLPLGIFLGGAPLNVAYHLSRLGVTALPVSGVGHDFLGVEARRRIAGWGVSTDHIARLKLPTGTVLAELDTQGSAHYTIRTRVAWDRIPASRVLRQRRAPAALVFGSLALRSAANRAALTELLLAWPEALRIVDLNLRAPFDRGPGVAFALHHAEFVKL
ncbi:MAG TPA: PfkB family carbohydrate kinase, partial [Opitutaceae bacterium]